MRGRVTVRTRIAMGIEVLFDWAVLVVLGLGVLASLGLVAHGLRHRA